MSFFFKRHTPYAAFLAVFGLAAFFFAAFFGAALGSSFTGTGAAAGSRIAVCI